MGPRQDAGEDAEMMERKRSFDKRFNGAPAGCRGRPASGSYRVCFSSSLQWGPGRMPGKTHNSTVLRRCYRQLLQWGPGRMPGKTRQSRTAHISPGHSFNGAPAGCRGRLLSGIGLTRSLLSLQWGPGRMPGKTYWRDGYIPRGERFNGAPAGCRGRRFPRSEFRNPKNIASMGPRQDAGEDDASLEGYLVAGQSFNGAPAGCRGRLIGWRVFSRTRAGLQWGPGRMPGKTLLGLLSSQTIH